MKANKRITQVMENIESILMAYKLSGRMVAYAGPVQGVVYVWIGSSVSFKSLILVYISRGSVRIWGKRDLRVTAEDFAKEFCQELELCLA